MSNLHDLFYPKNIAIIGASTKIFNFGGAFFTTALKELGYSSKVYYINPKYVGELINGEKMIASLDEVGHPIDLVYSCIRAELVPELVKQCVERKDKFIVVFTSGFSELLSEEAIKLEKELVSIIKGSSTRIIGPNCLGPYNPDARVGWNTGLKAPLQLGNVAFASQSGGHASTLLRVAPGRGFYYSKGLSFGNQIDINCLEVLEYYSEDPQSEVIALYLEDTGSAKGSKFFQKLRETTKKKPVIVWKGGQTEVGARAAASHTGAIQGSYNMWETMTKQAGGIFVKHSEEFWDMIHLLSIFVPFKKIQRCQKLGLIIPGGGNSVEGTDLYSRFGFDVPLLSQETQENIAKLIPSVNTSVKNPVDLGASGTLERVFLNSIRYVAEDPQIDLIINYQPIDWICQTEIEMGVNDYVRSLTRSYGRLIRKLEKPFIQLSPVLKIDDRIAVVYTDFIEALRKKGIPTFPSMERLAVSLKHLNEYVRFLRF